MIKKVIKRDGRKEDFISEKIVVSAIKSNADPKIARKIAKDIERKIDDGTETRKIREMVLEKLASENPDWKENWLIYDKAVKKSSIDDGLYKCSVCGKKFKKWNTGRGKNKGKEDGKKRICEECQDSIHGLV